MRAIALAAAGWALAGIVFFAWIWDYAAYVDGPGIGIGGGADLVWLPAALILAIVAAARLTRRLERKRAMGAAALLGIALLAVFVELDGPYLPFVTSWRHRCARGNGQACFALAGLYQIGRGAPHDHDRAQSLYDRGCNLGCEMACSRLRRP